MIADVGDLFSKTPFIPFSFSFSGNGLESFETYGEKKTSGREKKDRKKHTVHLEYVEAIHNAVVYR